MVTGAAGFIGSRICTALAEGGWSVLGIDRLSPYYDAEIKRRHLAELHAGGSFESVETDLADGNLERVCEGADAIFHFAAQPGARGGWGDDFDTYARDNVIATQRLLASAAAAGVGRVIYASSSSVYADGGGEPVSEDHPTRPTSPYGATKLAGEQLCALYAAGHGLDVVTLRCFTVFGPGQRPDMAAAKFLSLAAAGHAVDVNGDGEQEREMTYVGDVVAASLLALEHGSPGATYNIAGGVRSSVNGLIEEVGALLGRLVETRPLPPARGELRQTAGDTTLARDELGWFPKVGLREGLERQLEDLARFQPLASG